MKEELKVKGLGFFLLFLRALLQEKDGYENVEEH